jgi:hypothetical protein
MAHRLASTADGGRRSRKGERGGPSGRGGGQAWLSFYNPWTISMWPGQAPSASCSPAPVLLTAPPYGVPPTTPAQPQLPPPGTPTTTPRSSLARGWDIASLAAAFSTMVMAPPSSNWAVDSGVPTNTPTVGTLSRSYPPFLPSLLDRRWKRFHSTGHLSRCLGSPWPFYLNDVPVASHITHNLLSVRRFTADNSCSIEFDPSGFSMKDLATRTPHARCDSSGPLYTLQPSTIGVSPPPVLVSTTSFTTWHRRLDHPRPNVMTKITNSLDLSCSKGHFEGLCHACRLGRHTRLPFTSSRAEQAFDLVHCDIWTSPVLNLSGYKYYMVILDDCSHFPWTFPLLLKSDTFTTLTHFFAWIPT